MRYKEMMCKTINYYNKNSILFYESTIGSDMSDQYIPFEKRLHKGARILDCGCGSGRDSKYFLQQGYVVDAIDGSEEMCRLASKFTGFDVRNIRFQDMDYIHEFDGIWACASLLHVPKSELLDVMKKIIRAMKEQGILYVSFKYGAYEGERNGRYFTDFTEETFGMLIAELPELIIQETFISSDVRPGRGERWFNAILMKSSL